MTTNLKNSYSERFRFFSLLGIFALIIFSGLAGKTSAATMPNAFNNPLLIETRGQCAEGNINSARFENNLSPSEMVSLCRSIEQVASTLRTGDWSDSLGSELASIWQVFARENVQLKRIDASLPKRVLAVAEPFPDGTVGNRFEAGIYIRPDKVDSEGFFQVLLHEMRHVYDFYQTWSMQSAIANIEVERRAFLLMSRLSEESHSSGKFSGVPSFWKKKWLKLSADEAEANRQNSVNKYLQKNKIYRRMAESNEQLDFTAFAGRGGAAAVALNRQPLSAGSPKSNLIGRRPDPRPAPPTSTVLSQNIKDTDFNLARPASDDPQEILRTALANEKKLYYGMSNFVYDQSLAFKCWHKKKQMADFTENTMVARTSTGKSLLQTGLSASAKSLTPCKLDYTALSTDFSETFWASPVLEQMPIRFSGFVTEEGKKVARYDVLQPSRELFEKMEKEFDSIKPFRVFVGSIYVSVEDGQIVKFWGTSFPETITGAEAQNERNSNASSNRVWGSYSVKAVRQRLNIKHGLWVTVHIGTVAVANVKGKAVPFSYTVNFNNYRQVQSDVRILDEVEAVTTTPASVPDKSGAMAKSHSGIFQK